MTIPRSYSLNKSVLYLIYFTLINAHLSAFLFSAHTRYAKSVLGLTLLYQYLTLSPRRLYKIVFPNGLDQYDTPSASNASSRQGSLLSVAAHQALASPATPTSTVSASSRSSTSFFSRLGLSRAATPSGATTPTSVMAPAEDGPIEEMIISGTAFGTRLLFSCSVLRLRLCVSGHGLFNLVLSLLPAKVKYVQFVL